MNRIVKESIGSEYHHEFIVIKYDDEDENINGMISIDYSCDSIVQLNINEQVFRGRNHFDLKETN